MDLNWIKKGLEKPGKSRKGLALSLGRAPSMVTALLDGKRQLKAREISIVSKYLEVQPPDENAKLSKFAGPSSSLKQNAITTLKIVGEVAAGVWRDAEADAVEPEDYPVPSDDRFPIGAQFLLRVRGSSINRRAADGSLVRCLDIWSAPRPPAHGDWVIARRMRNGSAEMTVKQLRIAVTGRQELWPDSDDKRWQEPLIVGKDDGDEVVIHAFVLDFINPATRL